MKDRWRYGEIKSDRHDALCPKCGSNWVKKDGHPRGKQIYKRYQRRHKRQEGAKRRFTDRQKKQAVKMRAEGMILSATARVAGVRLPTVSKWGKKEALATERLTRFLEWQTKWSSGQHPRVYCGV